MNYNAQLYQAIYDTFDLSDIRKLCFDLSLPTEDILRKTKQETLIELIEYCRRQGKIEQLIVYCTAARPDSFNFTIPDEAPVDPAQQAEWAKGLEKYYARLKQQVGFVRILGRANVEPLDNVFTHVNVLDRITTEKRHGIEQLIAEAHPRDFEQIGRTERIAGDAAVAEYSKLFVLGKPGAGKTTFLKHTALRAIKHEIKKIPIFVTLKELSDSGLEIFPFIVD